MTRKEAREYIIKHCNPHRDTGTKWDDAMECAIKALGEPERKKGKWIGKEQFANSPEFYSWQCSVCGCVLEDPTLDKPYPFCPNCGSFNGGEQV